jgi:hypothetical protein
MLTYHRYAALFKTPHALAGGLMIVFQHPAETIAIADVGLK